MTSLVGERSPIRMLSRKHSLEHGGFGARDFSRDFKRRRISVVRQFPGNCGASATKVCETFNEGGPLVETSNERWKAGPYKPLVEVLPTKLNFECMTPPFGILPNELKFESIEAPIFHGKTFLKNVEMGFLKVPEKVDLNNARNNHSIPKHIEPPKFRKGVTIFRDFPKGCGKWNIDLAAKCDVLRELKSTDGCFDKNCKVDLINARNNHSIPKHIEPPKFRKGVTVFRDFPRGCGKWNIDLGAKCDVLRELKSTDGCFDKNCKLIGDKGSCHLLLKHSDTKPEVHVEASQSNAVSGQTHNGALLVKKSNDSTINRHEEASSRTKFLEVLNLFENLLKKHLLEIQVEEKSTGKKNISSIYVKIAMVLKRQGKWIYMNQRMLGAIPGVKVGDQFHYRAELVIVGLHGQFFAGIDYMEKDGKKIATSIVFSGRYSKDKEFSDYLIYSGEGGNEVMGDKNSKDQALVRGNLALKNSMDEETPVRVIRGRRSNKEKSRTFMYDGLYIVTKFWHERAQNGKLVYMFQLNRMHGEPKHKSRPLQGFGKSKARHCRTLINDISSGEEKISICVTNHIDNDKPPTFKYITKMVYPQLKNSLVMMSGCNCIDGCSDHVQCSCIIKNEGMVPFNKKGALLETKPIIVHECGPSCKCPLFCKNRVSQHGLKFQLEVFKTERKGWGVRSRNFISSGSFICEYIGELLNDGQAEETIGSDEYLFDIGDEDGFVIDAAQIGNIGRFLNHSCSPNLCAQNVLYDHGDEMMPHVMLFATKNIRPLQELTYNYNFKVDGVHDSNGNVKKKICYCGASECTERMY